MKKYLVMFVAIGMMAIPLKASNLVEQLCEDETFVAFITETEQMKEYIATLSIEERKNFQATEAYACYRETLLGQMKYLSTTYKLNEQADSKVMLVAAGKVSSKKQTQDEECLVLMMAGIAYCDNQYPLHVRQYYQTEYMACLANVWLLVDTCLGLPQA